MSFWSKWSDKLYNSQQKGWLGEKVNHILGDDFQHHLTDFTVSGEPFQANYMSYQDAKQNGESGWHRVNQNDLKVAALAAAIFGGAAAAGGGSAGSGAGAGAGGAGLGTEAGIGASAGSAVPVEEAGFAAGSTPSGAGWTTGTGGGTFGAGQGSGLMGNNYLQLLSKGLNGYNQGSSRGQSQGSSNFSPEATQDSYAQQPAQAPSGAYSPLAPNPYKLPNIPQGMAYNDPNNPSFPTNSMNPYAINSQMQNPFNSGLYAMGATNA